MLILILGSIGFNLVLPLINKTLVDDAIIGKDLPLLIKLLFVYLGAILAGEVINISMDFLQNIVQERISRDLYLKIFNKLLKLKIKTLDKYSEGEILNRFFIDAESLKSLMADFFITIITQIIYFIGILIVMMKLCPKVTLLVLIPVVLYPLLFRFSNKRVRFYSREIRAKYDHISLDIKEASQGQVEIRVFAMAEMIYDKFKIKLNDLYDIVIKSVVQSNIIKTLMNSLSVSANLILWFYGGYLVIKGELTLGTLWALTTYLSQLYDPIQILAGKNFKIQKAFIGIERLKDFLDSATEHDEGNSGEEQASFKDKISIKNLSFSYGNEEAKVIKNLTLDIRSGERVWIVGENGSGKTTLIKILLGLYCDDYGGDILIDGQNVKGISLESYRKNFSYVAQTPYLFSGSISENVLLSSAATFGGSGGNILKLIVRKFKEQKVWPNNMKLNRLLKSGGSNLSGGQKQLVTILRGLCKDAPIIIIDEGTTNLDQGIQSVLEEMLENEFKDKTVIRVSHQSNPQWSKNYRVISLSKSLNNKKDKDICEEVYQLIQDNSLDLAEDKINKFLENKNNNKNKNKNKAHVTLLNYLGYIKYTKNDFESCRSINSRVLEISPNDPYAHKGMGLTLVELGEFDQGVSFLRRAIELDPFFFDAYHDLCLTYYKHGQIEKAKELISEMEVIFSTDVKIMMLIQELKRLIFVTTF
ncbi:MAG: ATP-binding cassette domain-containing protein [Oligoflexia bacterium]|nr:ATP-binding cassette domain-containing protein [Oligoflexia bacterium]